MTAPHRVVVVGAGAAALSTVQALRDRGYDGALTMVGEEPHPPYDRPPLSKKVLAGEWDPDRVILRGPGELAALDVDLLLGRRATGLDLAARRVLLDRDDRIGFDRLVIATGAVPRRPPGGLGSGSDLAGVHVLRSVDDALSLRARLLERPAVVVVGAGFLGCEVAATARGMGLDVTLVDPSPVPMRRQFGDRVGALIGRLHAAHGTSVRYGTGVRRFLGAAGRVTGVELSDGSVLDAGLVVVAIGARPAADWAASSGLPVADGIACDRYCRAAPGVYAAGDVASWHNERFGVRMRLEHRLNATEQGMAVAGNLLGADRPFSPVPYFWTDQYDARIQAYGVLPAGADVTVLHGDPEDGGFVAGYGRHGRVVGVLGWNSPRELRRLRSLVADGAPWPPPATASPERKPEAAPPAARSGTALAS